ncbi:MAG: ATP-binding protein [Elusimicrobiota bacterium]
MDIKEFAITSYGPLKVPRPVKTGKFNLIFGSNESGKSLLLDALVKLMLDKKVNASPKGTNARFFQNIDRVDEFPEGYVRLKLNGKEFKLPEAGNLKELTGLQPGDCSNIFFVRNSELSLFEKGDRKYFENVTDRLTGIRINEIAKILEKIRERAHVTPGYNLQNRKESNHLKDRWEKAKECLEQIEEFEEKAKTEELYNIEERLQKVRKDIKMKHNKMDKLYAARKREDYKTLHKNLKKYRENIKKEKEYEKISRQDFSRWKKYKERIEELQEDKRKIWKKIEKLKEEVKKLTDPLIKAEQEKENLKKDIEYINENIRPEIKKFEEIGRRFPTSKTVKRFLTLISVFFGMTVLFFIAFHWPVSYIIVPLIIILTGILKPVIKEHKLSQCLYDVNNLLSPMGLSGDTIDEIKQNIKIYKDKLDNVVKKHRELNREKSNRERDIERFSTEDIPEIDKKIKENKKKVKKIKQKSATDRLENYQKKLKKKEEISREASEARTVLKSRLSGPPPEDRIDWWEEKLEELEPYKDSSKDFEYSERRESEIKNEIDKLNQKLEDTESQYKEIITVLDEIEGEISDILSPENVEIPPCRNLTDLPDVEKVLEDFRTEYEDKREQAKIAEEIFKQIEKGERSKIEDLFGVDSSITANFKNITSTGYKSVNYSKEDNTIRLLTAAEKELVPEQLSGGTFDQLYFSIRISLGEKLLGENPGFFIMDDPFIKSDKQRLEKQIEMLKNITKRGWQIFYFSAKNEVREAVGKIFGRKNYIEIAPPGI